MTNEELVKEFQDGKKEVIETLYKQNLGLIRKIANLYAADDFIFDDLVQEGYLALFSAAEQYQGDFGANFCTYLFIKLKSCMGRYIATKTTMAHIPTGRLSQCQKMDRIIKEYEQATGQKPTKEIIAALMETSKESFKQIEQAHQTRHCQSIDEPISNASGETFTLAETIAGDLDMAEEVIQQVAQNELAKALWQEVDNLGGTQSKVIKGIYQDNKTLEEVGKAVGISKEGARQSRNKAIKRLKQPAILKKLEGLYFDVYGGSIGGCGLRLFQTTFTSSTERSAFLDMEFAHRWQKALERVNFPK